MCHIMIFSNVQGCAKREYTSWNSSGKQCLHSRRYFFHLARWHRTSTSKQCLHSRRYFYQCSMQRWSNACSLVGLLHLALWHGTWQSVWGQYNYGLQQNLADGAQATRKVRYHVCHASEHAKQALRMGSAGFVAPGQHTGNPDGVFHHLSSVLQ